MMIINEQQFLTRKLAYFLRHVPPCKIDNCGWVNIDDILPHLIINRNKLYDIIENDHIKRFVIDSKNDRIRAYEGHSICLLDPMYRKITHDEIFPYIAYITTEHTWYFFKKTGYITKNMRSHHVYFITNPFHFREDLPVTLSLNIYDAIEDGYEFHMSTCSTGMIITEQNIPLKYIKRIT